MTDTSRNLFPKIVRASGAMPALAIAVLLAPGSQELAVAAKKDGMVDYSAPVRVRVKRPASADQIDPSAFQGSDEEMAAGYEGKQMEVVHQRTVTVPNRTWRQGDLDELPPPAWEDCKKTKPRFRPLEGPHGRLSGGVIYRDFGKTEFAARSFSGVEHIPLAATGLIGAPPEDGLADREYADGFVRVGSGTQVSGLTTYWGYADQAQYDVGAGTLAFQGSGIEVDRSGFSSQRSTERWGEDLDGMGPIVTFDLLFPISENWRIGQQTSFSFVRTGTSRQIGNFAAQLRDDLYTIAFTDTFDLGGVIPPIAPYSGTFGGPGPVIPNEPISRDITDSTYLTTTVSEVYNELYQELDVDLYTISLGGVAEFDLGPMFAQASGGLAINVADYDATHFEKLYLAVDGESPEVLQKWYQDDRGTKVLFGVYVQGALGVQLSQYWSLSGFARYDWNDDLEGSIGPSDFRMELSAFSAGGQLGFSF